MKIPQFGKPQDANPYEIPQPGEDKKRTAILMFGGLAVVLLLLAVLLFGGKQPGGQQDLLTVVNETGASLAAINSYKRDLKTTPAQNDVALINTILTGNYQNLGNLYKKTFSSKQSFTKTTRAQPADQKILEAAVKNDTVDTELPKLLSTKIIRIEAALRRTKTNFTGEQSRATLSTAQQDYASITRILEKRLDPTTAQ